MTPTPQELSPAQRDYLLMGLCPFCTAPIRNYQTPVGSFAPEVLATLREHGRDPSNGHYVNCPQKDVTI